MSQEPTIRPARPGDLPTLVALIRALAAHHGDDAPLGLATARRLFCDSGAPAIALLAARPIKDDVVGYAALLDLPDLRDGSLRMLIDHLYVVPEARGHGIGTALVRAAADIAREKGATRLRIGTDPDNPAAARAYRAMGFVELPLPGPAFLVPL